MEPRKWARIRSCRLEVRGVRSMRRAVLVRVVAACVVGVLRIVRRLQVASWASAGCSSFRQQSCRHASSDSMGSLVMAPTNGAACPRCAQKCPRNMERGYCLRRGFDLATSKQYLPKDEYLVVRQTASLVSVKLLTDESKSSSSLAAVSIVDSSSVLDSLYLNRCSEAQRSILDGPR